MRKCSSPVWRFFERIEENGRCVSVLCKLCENQYKYFGNTTNLRVHLTTKHPIQWELAQNGTLESPQFRIEDNDITEQSSSTPVRRKYATREKKNVRYSLSVDNNEQYEGVLPKIEIQRVDVLEHSDTDGVEDNVASVNLVKQLHNRQSGEEWLDDDPYQITHIETYEPVPKRKNKMKYRRVREVQSPSGLPGYYVAPKPEKTVLYENVNHTDEYSVFGEYVANKLRKVKTPRTRGNLQQLITTILWQAEYGMYDNAEAVKRVLMYSVTSPEPEASFVDYNKDIQTGDESIGKRDDDEINQSLEESESIVVINAE